ncbi:response regulator transcription factor [Salinarimonas chemoclinalis]|uniref:response regulator transcription factor n=1 Tax=Salinarimonas chemoclinalis TaxID=3241599 RepID=UPI003555F69A
MVARRVLVAEDEEPMRVALARLLAAAGHDVETAGDGEAALAALRRAPPDCAVLDAMLAGRDGWDLCRAVRADPALGGIRIVLTSPRGRPVDREKARALGADAMLTKPFGFADLMAALAGTEAAP